jgi:hypothetical protein
VRHSGPPPHSPDSDDWGPSKQRLQQQQANQLGNGTAAPPLLNAHPPPRTATSTPAQQYPQLLTVPEQHRPFTSRPLRAQQHTILSEGHLQQVLAQLQQDFGGEGYTEGMPQYQLQPVSALQPQQPVQAPVQRPRQRRTVQAAPQQQTISTAAPSAADQQYCSRPTALQHLWPMRMCRSTLAPAPLRSITPCC